MCAICAAGCRCVDDSAAPRPAGGSASGRGSGARRAIAPPRALGVLQLEHGGVGEAPVGCQLHLIDVPLAGGRTARELHVDLGTTRRRSFFLKRKAYWRLPARFGYIGPQKPDRIALHTTVAGAHGLSVRRPPARRFVRRRLRSTAPRWPRRWGVSCVLRKKGGDGAVIDAAFIKGGRPRVYGVRRAKAAQLTPEKVRAFLRRLIGEKVGR